MITEVDLIGLGGTAKALLADDSLTESQRITSLLLTGSRLGIPFTEGDAGTLLEKVRGGAPSPEVPEVTVPWPVLHTDALYGLAGDIVRAVDPHTEADPVAVLLNVLTMFGNVVGHAPHAIADHSRHTMNLFVVQVGNTSQARKGTALAVARTVFEQVDETWVSERILCGLSTGEGLINAVRDDLESEGDDKRVLACEEEFATVLKRMRGETNTLSQTLRQAWDTGHVRTLTRAAPLRASGAHVSIIAHITSAELLRYLGDTEAANGFGNRFLWACVRRSKRLPRGGGVLDLHSITPTLHEAVEWAKRHPERFTYDSEAQALWDDRYAALTEERTGLLGDITARAAAHVLRVSVIYAAMDRSTQICLAHLKAALAVWSYCDASAAHIFGDGDCDDVADRIVSALRSSRGELSQNDLVNLFGRHMGRNRLNQALDSLRRSGRITQRIESTGGRPVTLYALAR
jgi:hypothetical protein